MVGIIKQEKHIANQRNHHDRHVTDVSDVTGQKLNYKPNYLINELFMITYLFHI